MIRAWIGTCSNILVARFTMAAFGSLNLGIREVDGIMCSLLFGTTPTLSGRSLASLFSAGRSLIQQINQRLARSRNRRIVVHDLGDAEFLAIERLIGIIVSFD